MTSLILRTATRALMPLLLLYGLFLLLRGHNAPGGGFAGGLVVAAAYALHAFAYGVDAARRAVIIDTSQHHRYRAATRLGKRPAPASLWRSLSEGVVACSQTSALVRHFCSISASFSLS